MDFQITSLFRLPISTIYVQGVISRNVRGNHIELNGGKVSKGALGSGNILIDQGLVHNLPEKIRQLQNKFTTLKNDFLQRLSDDQKGKFETHFASINRIASVDASKYIEQDNQDLNAAIAWFNQTKKEVGFKGLGAIDLK